MLLRLLAAALAAALLACGSSQEEGDARAEGAARPDAGGAVAAGGRPAHERPLPAFSGPTLDGGRLAIRELLGRRVVLFFFDPAAEEARPVARALAALAALRTPHNFEVVGVAGGPDRAASRAFAQEWGAPYPVIDDSRGEIARTLGLPGPVAVLGADAEGFAKFLYRHFGDDAGAAEARLRQALRLPAPGDAPEVAFGERPTAPAFSAEVLDSDEPFRLSEQRGRAVLLVFFLHTCPHCHHVLEFMRENLPKIPEERRPLLVGVEVSGRTAAVRGQLRELDLDFFPVVFDRDAEIRDAYGVFAGVPDTFLIDPEGRIAHRIEGWPEQAGPILRMRMAKVAGAPVPMLLRTRGYSGNEVCGVCHEAEYATWEFTSHAHAFDTLIEHGADNDPECIGCHVVGFGETGGYAPAEPVAALEDVGCESCHGRGGPHVSPGAAGGDGYESACASCHTPKHSLGFEYATFLPRVSHATNRPLLSLPAEEKRRLLAERGRPGGSLLPTRARHVGSEACASCHPAETATWREGPHAHAVETLSARGEAANADCLRCHTTGFGREGGFPEGGAVAAHPDLARVGCESCHGPGGDHVAPDAERIGSIVSLGDKCDSCVILQICGSCHDEANDPGFEFEVLEKIERQRHGTIEAGTGKPLGAGGETAARAVPAPLVAARLLARAEGDGAWSPR